MIVPSILVAGQQTQVTVTCFVRGADSSTQVQLFNISGSTPVLIGTMSDDGQNGDQTAGDQVYTIVTNLTPPSASSLPLQVVATTGTSSSQSANFSVQLVQISTYTTNTDVNQAESNVYNTAIQTRSSLGNPDWSNPALLQTVTSNLVSMYGQLVGVVNQNSGLAPSFHAEGHRAADLGIGKTESDGILSGIAGFFSPLLGWAQSSDACNKLIGSLGDERGQPDYAKYGPPLDQTDPNLVKFATELANLCPTDSQCQALGTITADDLIYDGNPPAVEWAREYMATGPSLPTPIDGCGGGGTQQAANIDVTSEVGQFTDIAGDGIGSMSANGKLAQTVVGQVASQGFDTIVGAELDSSGKPTVIIGQIGADQTIPAPTGTYNLMVGFGGSTANGTITNTPVYPSTITNIVPSPGTNITVTPPYVQALSPSSGPVGTSVTVTGTGFSANPSGEEVTFNGTAAQISSATTTAIQAVVPAGASSGSVSVTTTSGMTISGPMFTVSGSAGNPAPETSNLLPTTVPAGTSLQQLVIDGSGFVLSSTVTFNGKVHLAQFVTPNQLIVFLNPADLASAGTYPVVVTNPSPGGGSSSPIGFLVTSTSPGTVLLNTPNVSVPVAGLQTFSASVIGGGDVTWSIQEGSAAGSIVNSTTTSLTYSPPDTLGTYHIIATNSSDSAQQAVAVVTVVAPIEPMTVFSFPLNEFGAYASALFGEGSSPGPLLQASNGTLFGTTNGGGNYQNYSGVANCYNGGCGGVFNVTPSGQFSLLHLFSGTDGGSPYSGLTLGPDGAFYGMTWVGGASSTCVFNGGMTGCGTVFKIDANGTFSLVHSFTGSDGAFPQSGLLLGADGNLYGTTSQGGTPTSCTNFQTPGCGTIFKMDSSGNVTVVHSFVGTDGATPNAALLQTQDGSFYGTTTSGGASNGGIIFQINPAGKFQVLHSFVGSDGSDPSTALTQAADGNIYGTTCGGGANKYYGVVFRIDTTGTFSVLHNFAGADGACGSSAMLQGNDGFLYGTTSNGGSASHGTLFRMDYSGNITVLHSFVGSEGSDPQAPLIQVADGSIYGTTFGGGTDGGGVVYRLSNAGGAISVAISPSPAIAIEGNAQTFTASLVNSTNGVVWSIQEGSSGGTISSTGPTTAVYTPPATTGTFHIIATSVDDPSRSASLAVQVITAPTYTVLHAFSATPGSAPDGSVPSAGLIQGSDGRFYGTTELGGSCTYAIYSACGTVFAIDSAGNETVLHDFAGPTSDGANPTTPLLQTADGQLYGEAGGGAFTSGIFFRISSSGQEAILHNFSTAEGNPNSPLIQATDGDFYGTTSGGTGANGAVFKVDSIGNLTILHIFSGGTGDGSSPRGGLVQATDGNFYGVTGAGGSDNDGTVFRMAPNGTAIVLHSFTGLDGLSPQSLVQASDGNLYGSAQGGFLPSFPDGGVLFKISLNGDFTTIHFFSSAEGYNGAEYGTGTILGLTTSGSYLYGVSTGGSGYSNGFVFRSDLSGDVTILHNFGGTEGMNPSGVMLAPDGNLYGTTSRGGANGGGVVFKIALPTP
jgi:uncharacterized repeat protein (TIGR03803 family)